MYSEGNMKIIAVFPVEVLNICTCSFPQRHFLVEKKSVAREKLCFSHSLRYNHSFVTAASSGHWRNCSLAHQHWAIFTLERLKQGSFLAYFQHSISPHFKPPGGNVVNSTTLVSMLILLAVDFYVSETLCFCNNLGSCICWVFGAITMSVLKELQNSKSIYLPIFLL